jgi:segregation and condensation protein B
MSEVEELSSTVEALIFAAGAPVSVARIRRVLPKLTARQIAGIVEEVNQALDREGRPYEIAEVGGGYQFRTRPEFAREIRAMQPERKLRLSRAALETLAVIAYRQPTTRAEIEDLRCVDCGAVLKSLLERSLVRIVGRRDAPGRPVLYGTSAKFLETFGLHSLSDLPELRDISSLEEKQGTPMNDLAGALISGQDEGAVEIPEVPSPPVETPPLHEERDEGNLSLEVKGMERDPVEPSEIEDTSPH